MPREAITGPSRAPAPRDDVRRPTSRAVGAGRCSRASLCGVISSGSGRGVGRTASATCAMNPGHRARRSSPMAQLPFGQITYLARVHHGNGQFGHGQGGNHGAWPASCRFEARSARAARWRVARDTRPCLHGHGPHASAWVQDGRRYQGGLSRHQSPQRMAGVSSFGRRLLSVRPHLAPASSGSGNCSGSFRKKHDDPAHGRSLRIPMGTVCSCLQ